MSARAWTCFAAVSVLWGVPYLFIKLAVDEVDPGFVAWSRVALGTLVLAPVALRAGALRGLGARWRAVLAYAVLEIVIPFPLISFGEQRVSSSLTAILVAAVPLTIAMLALRFDPSERVDGKRLAGLVVGLAGVVALVGLDVAGSASAVLGTACVLAAVVGYAAGPMVLRLRLGDVDPRGLVTASLATAAVLLAPLGLAGAPSTMPSATVLASIAVLGVACSALAFVLFATLIQEVGPGRAAVITYVAPVVAVALGVTLLGESLGVGAVAGLLLILAGSWLSTDGRLPPGTAALVARLGPRRGGPDGPEPEPATPPAGP
jgi:drug/metabolite transporter (DMT)-like permease